jgi:predicted CopG family antitoxin
MARTISVADDVFEWLKNEKEDKSYSELLREFRDNKSLSEVSGINSLKGVPEEEIFEVIEEAEKESEKKIEEQFS